MGRKEEKNKLYLLYSLKRDGIGVACMNKETTTWYMSSIYNKDRTSFEEVRLIIYYIRLRPNRNGISELKSIGVLVF